MHVPPCIAPCEGRQHDRAALVALALCLYHLDGYAHLADEVSAGVSRLFPDSGVQVDHQSSENLD